MESTRTLLHIFSLTLCILAVGLQAAVATEPDIAKSSGTLIEEMSRADRKTLEKMLDRELMVAAERIKLLEGQRRFNIKTLLVPFKRKLVIDLGRDAVPSNNGSALEEQNHQLMLTAMELTREIISIDEYEFRYGGHDIYFYHPERLSQPTRSATKSTATPLIMVAAGHGIYYHHGFGDWRAQRDPYNGVTEDFITPYFSRDLATQLTSRARVSVAKARTNDVDIHASTGQPWWKLAARYYLKSQYPDNPEIWNSLPTSISDSRERDEDIRSRPLFANQVGANYVINLHTDGSQNPGVRGTKAYYQTGRDIDAALATNILCNMKQTIQAKSTYADWDVALAPIGSDKGENRLATSPAVIIELGFHTNPSDAAALQSATFRTAAVKGIERGMVDHPAGIACFPFRISDIPKFGALTNAAMDMVVHFQGTPRFPVVLRTRNIKCPTGWTCGPTTKSFYLEQDSPLVRRFSCTGTPPASGTFLYAATLTDADGVAAGEFQYTYTCTVPV